MQHFLRKFQKLSLIWQFTLAVMLILFIPSILIMIIYIHTFQSSLIEQQKAILQRDLNQLSYTMDSSVHTIDSAIAELVYQQEFSYFLNDKTILTQQEQAYFTSNLRSSTTKFKNLYPNYFKHIAIYSANTQIPESFNTTHDFIYLERLLQTNYIHTILDAPSDLIHGKIRNPAYTYPNSLHEIKVKEIDSLVIPVYQKIFNLNSADLIGMIEINISLDKMVPFDTLVDTDASVSYFLYDPDKDILYSIDGSESPTFTQATFDAETGFTSGTLGKEKHFFAYSLCNKTNMIRITALSQHSLQTPVRDMILRAILVVSFALLLVIGLTYLAVSLLLRRLSEMGEMINKIEHGDFNIHVNENGADEISKIAKSFNKMGSQLQNTLHALIAQEKARQETELRALESQINPHFLYNTLENIRMQCEINEYYQIGDGVAALGELFRYSIKWSGGEVPFALEWKHLKSYLAIMKLRHESHLSYELDYADNSKEMDDITVPKFILQPLVENCFNHGFRNKLPPLILRISAYIDSSCLHIDISDNGSGIPHKRLLSLQKALKEGTLIEQAPSHHSIGLSNVKQRIDMLCKKNSELTITSKMNHGTTIHIRIIL